MGILQGTPLSPDEFRTVEEQMSQRPLIRRLLSALVGMFLITNAAAQEPTSMQGPTTLSETYDAWTVQCVNQVQGERTLRSCQMSQELLQQETRQRVLLFAISKEAEATPKATLVLPFGLLLAEGIRIQVGESEVVRGAFRTCFPAGCVVELEMSDDVIGQLQGAESVSVLMTANTGQPVKTDVSLKGFASAYRRLVELAAG